MDMFILTAAQVSAVKAWNCPTCEIEPRAINNPLAVAAINVGVKAAGIAVGAQLLLAGKFAAPCRIVDDVACPAPMQFYLQTMPVASVDPSAIFL